VIDFNNSENRSFFPFDILFTLGDTIIF